MRKAPKYRFQLREGSTAYIPLRVISLRSELSNTIPRSTYLTHGIHPYYPAKFIPQVPQYVIRKYLRGARNTILDPFAGSATTAVEAVLTGNQCIASDINPLTVFLCRAKLPEGDREFAFQLQGEVEGFLRRLNSSDLTWAPRWNNVGYWFPEEVWEPLTRLWGPIQVLKPSVLKDLLMVSALAATRAVSFADDRVPKLFRSKFKKAKIEALIPTLKRDRDFVFRIFREFVWKHLKMMQAFLLADHREFVHLTEPRAFSVDASGPLQILSLSAPVRELRNLLRSSAGDSEFINAIITSPPYLYAQEYFRSTKLDLFWLALADEIQVKQLTRQEIGQRVSPIDGEGRAEPLLQCKAFQRFSENLAQGAGDQKWKDYQRNLTMIEGYFRDMAEAFADLTHLLRPKGIFGIFVGEPKVLGHQSPIHQIFLEILDGLGYDILECCFDEIKSRNLFKGRQNLNPEGMRGEWLIIASKK